MNPKAQDALNTIVSRFQSGDIAPIVQIACLRMPASWPAAHWTLANQVLAYMQTSTLDCRGYQQWITAKRQVQRGTHSAYIWAPILKATETEDGTKETHPIGFIPISVFPITATEGDPIADTFSPRTYPQLYDLTRSMGIEIEYIPIPQARGDCNTSGTRIHLATHHPKTFYHELAHACHARINGKLKGGQDPKQEIIAEFASCVLMSIYEGEDTTGNAWSYIQGYSNDPIQAITGVLSITGKILDYIENLKGKSQ